MDKEAEEDLHVAIAELIGILFKTHTNLCDGLFTYIYTNFLPNVLQDSATQKMHKFGIFLVGNNYNKKKKTIQKKFYF
jgi:importin-5